MPLSRRDFNDLAAIIRTTQTKWLGNGEAITAIGEVAYAITDLCAKYNPRFDRAKFLDACQVDGSLAT